ncbi:MAG TPA: flagellar biosynthetic protein FliO [Candidatus Cybelea sp.]|nr:flagellar biosynthetic protein FliO [Candidatus Cybelea sp.]
MPASFWAAYAIKLGVVAAVLAALYAGARCLRRSTWLVRRMERHVDVVESAMLAPNAALHVVRAGSRYFLLGSGGVSALAELEPGELHAKPRST